MIRWLVRLLYPYGSVRRVLRGPARGMRFVVEPAFGLSYAWGAARSMPRDLPPRVRRGMTVIDVGANKGQMTLLFAKLVGPSGRVVSFEPAPTEFRSLERNVRLNGLGQVNTVHAAVADSVGEMVLMYNAAFPTQGKLQDVEPTTTLPDATAVSVATQPLDALLQQGLRPDLIKIDVEGGAGGVLRGAARILETVGPGIYIELHGPEEQAAVRDELLTRGYVAETVEGTRVADPTVGWHDPLWCYRPGTMASA